MFRKPSCAATCSAGHEFIGARTANISGTLESRKSDPDQAVFVFYFLISTFYFV